MKMCHVLGGVVSLAVGFGAAAPALARIQVVDFAITGGGWFGGSAPYGLPAQPTLTGSVTIDDTLSGNAAFVDLNYTTGTRTWLLSDIIDGAFGGGVSGPYYDSSGVVDNFLLEMGSLGSETYVITNNTAGIDFPLGGDNSGTGIACNGCVSITSVSIAGVPEPAAWALMLVGFGGLGLSLRSRRNAAA
jgi:hypothetical protein